MWAGLLILPLVCLAVTGQALTDPRIAGYSFTVLQTGPNLTLTAAAIAPSGTTLSTDVVFPSAGLPSNCGPRFARCRLGLYFLTDNTRVIVSVPIGSQGAAVALFNTTSELSFIEQFVMSTDSSCTITTFVEGDRRYALCFDFTDGILGIRVFTVNLDFQQLSSSSLSRVVRERTVEDAGISFSSVYLSDLRDNPRLYWFDGFDGGVLFSIRIDIEGHIEKEFQQILQGSSCNGTRQFQEIGDGMYAAYCGANITIEFDISIPDFNPEPVTTRYFCSGGRTSYVGVQPGLLTLSTPAITATALLPLDVQVPYVADCVEITGVYYFIASSSDGTIVLIDIVSNSTTVLTSSSLVDHVVVADRFLLYSDSSGSSVLDLACHRLVHSTSTSFQLASFRANSEFMCLPLPTTISMTTDLNRVTTDPPGILAATAIGSIIGSVLLVITVSGLVVIIVITMVMCMRRNRRKDFHMSNPRPRSPESPSPCPPESPSPCPPESPGPMFRLSPLMDNISTLEYEMETPFVSEPMSVGSLPFVNRPEGKQIDYGTNDQVCDTVSFPETSPHPNEMYIAQSQTKPQRPLVTESVVDSLIRSRAQEEHDEPDVRHLSQEDCSRPAPPPETKFYTPAHPHHSRTDSSGPSTGVVSSGGGTDSSGPPTQPQPLPQGETSTPGDAGTNVTYHSVSQPPPYSPESTALSIKLEPASIEPAESHSNDPVSIASTESLPGDPDDHSTKQCTDPGAPRTIPTNPLPGNSMSYTNISSKGASNMYYDDNNSDIKEFSPVAPVNDNAESAAMQVNRRTTMPTNNLIPHSPTRYGAGESLPPPEQLRPAQPPSCEEISEDPALHVTPSQATPSNPSNVYENPTTVVTGTDLPVKHGNFHPDDIERSGSKDPGVDNYLLGKMGGATNVSLPDSEDGRANEDTPNNSRRTSQHSSYSEEAS